MTRPNGIHTNYSYDNLSQLLTVLHQSGTTTLDGANYTYDVFGNRTSKTDQLASVTSNYTYDVLNQLTQVAQGTNTTENYSYDSVGNRLSALGTASYNYNTSNQLTSTSSGSYTYDSNGNMLTDANGKSYTWDFQNRLVQVVVPGTGTTTFKYDASGRRIQKSGPQGTTNYLYDGMNLVEEVDGSGTVLARYTHGAEVDEDLAMLRNSTASYYQQDGLGSITSLSNSAGALVQTYTYDSFGNRVASTGTLTNPFQYTGREFDPETGIYYYRARYFDPSVGRFLSQDPIRFLSGVNHYAYTWNNPVILKDAFGDEGCNAEQWAQSPGACAGPQDPDSPYQGDDGLWHNVPDWQPTGINLLHHSWIPNNDDDDANNGSECPCNPYTLYQKSLEIFEEENDKDWETVGWAYEIFFTFQGIEKTLEHVAPKAVGEVAGHWIPVVDLAFFAHDIWELHKHRVEAHEKLKKLYNECGDNLFDDE